MSYKRIADLVEAGADARLVVDGADRDLRAREDDVVGPRGWRGRWSRRPPSRRGRRQRWRQRGGEGEAEAPVRPAAERRDHFWAASS
jgi:hypothetical protein